MLSTLEGMYLGIARHLCTTLFCGVFYVSQVREDVKYCLADFFHQRVTQYPPPPLPWQIFLPKDLAELAFKCQIRLKVKI